MEININFFELNGGSKWLERQNKAKVALFEIKIGLLQREKQRNLINFAHC